MNHQGAVGWNRFNDSVDSAFGKCNIKRADCGVDPAADLVAKLDGHRGIAGQQKAHIAHQISSFLVQAAVRRCSRFLDGVFHTIPALPHRDRYAGCCAAASGRDAAGQQTGIGKVTQTA